MLQNSANTIQPKVVVIRRRPNQGFGFTLRHFIAYPPEDDPSWPQEASDPYQVKAMETIFIKEVQPNGPAHYANLQTGDRVLMVNNAPIAGRAYSSIVSMIKQTPSVLTLHVVPKECDVLQMHYTSIAHTPESNRLAAVAVAVAPKPISTTVVGNGNAAGALIPMSVAAAKSFTQQQHHQLISCPQSVGQQPGTSSSRSGSVTSTTSGNLRPLTSGGGGGGGNIDFGDMTTAQGLHHSALLMRGGDGGFMRAQQPPNLTVLSRQQQQQNPTIYTTNPADTSDLMIRLRESIKQKEEFLKSPLPHAASAHQLQQQQQQHQHFFPHTPPSGSPQLSSLSTGGSSVAGGGPRGQVRTTLVKQPLSAASSTASSTRELLPASCDMQNFYAKNLPGNFVAVESMMKRSSGNVGGLHSEYPLARSQQRQLGNMSNTGAAGGGSGMRGGGGDKYANDLDYLETLQETGVTNKVFERKLVSHMSKGFDPFKPLSINTNAVVESQTAAGNVMLMKKPGVLYESLQHHPLHQLQLQQLQQPPKGHHYLQLQQQPQQRTSVVDGQQNSRMEIHKASLATAIDHTASSRYGNKLPEAEEKTTTTLTDIAESSEIMPITRAASDGVVRRYRPMSTFDDGKPMRRISYLRATNNENDYQSDASSSHSHSFTAASVPSTTLNSSSATNATNEAAKQQHQHIEEDPDPTYDVVGGCELETIEKSLMATTTTTPVDDARVVAAIVTSAANSGALCRSRRASVNSEIRNSVHIENVIADSNGKFETKDVSTEMEVFETEMEIKSSCINGKRISEYRSWRQVKIEIKGDILKIYSSRHSKSDNNVIELDIRNFKIFDESVDKKKYIFRMQSKPTTHIATLGNELSLEGDSIDKLTSSGSSSSTSALQLDQHHQHTEILFKTKSITEMKRIFGLLQWKNSLIYDDSDLQGKQLAEPQKTAATASMPTATYCDDSVQQPDYSPQSSTSRGELEPPPDSISPVMKTRKSSSHKSIPEKDLGSPKAKNWKDLLFRRGGGGSHNADISPSNLASSSKTTGSIGVPLKTCPPSKNNEFVPLIVEVCTNIVETKGLSVVGIYRIPGNKAAISELSDQVNKTDFCWDRCNTDVRWEDVNVVSSLLKLFIRSLPDALLPAHFYNHFIEADKKTGMLRLNELKDLLESLPRFSYETMKHLIRHLHRVSKNCDVNLMEPKNLAIIFGPSIIRTPNDTLEIAVKDMKHQCRIVELLVTQYEYFFENGSTPNIADVSGNAPSASNSGTTSASAQSQEDQTNMLLHNVSKIERLTERDTTTRTSRFIPQLRRRTHSKRSAVSSDTYSGESVLSLDYAKATTTTGSASHTTTGGGSSSSSANAATASSSSSSSTTHNTTQAATKKKERLFLGHGSRTHHRKASLDEKDSGSASGCSISKEKQQRSSVDISILLTDDESSNSRISDTGSMSLTTITDTLDSKLRNLRSGSESNDENGSPEFPKNRRHTFGQPLHLHSENIPYADESPERHFHNSCPLDAPNALMLSRSCTATNTIGGGGSGSRSLAITVAEERLKAKEQRPPITTAAAAAAAMAATSSSHKSNKLQHSATEPITPASSAAAPVAASTPTSAVVTVRTTTTTTGIGSSGGGSASARNSYTGKNLRFSSSVYEQCGGSEDDSEGSTTSDPKESSLIIASPSFFLDRYNKKRRDHRLFRSASFNCRNYSTRHGGGAATLPAAASSLTKDEKTDMNLTKKRQIQNKQNRSIKRRHTVGGPHDYAAATATTTTTTTTTTGGTAAAGAAVSGSNCNHHCKSNGGSNSGGGGGSSGGTTTTTTVLRRIPIPSANGNISNNHSHNINNNNNNNSSQQSSGSSDGGGNGNGGSATVAVQGAGGSEHVLEVGIRIKNINRSRY